MNLRHSHRTGAVVAVLALLLSSGAAASDGLEEILVYRNLFTFKLNGQVVPADNFVLDNEPYVPLSAAADALGLAFTWDAKTRVASVASKPPEAKTTTLKSQVDPYNPAIDLGSLGLTARQVDALALETGGSVVPVGFRFDGDQLVFTGKSAASPALRLNASYSLTIYARNGSSHEVRFSTSGLPDLTSTGQRRVVMVPAMPEKGFHWPYFLVLPSDTYKEANQGHKRYLVVEPNNTGTTDNSVENMIRATRDDAENSYFWYVREQLWSPFLIPAFPRPSVSYPDGTQQRMLYTHALDRDTAILHLDLENPSVATGAKSAIQAAGFAPESLLNLDRQLAAMIDHAVAYLNQYGHNVEKQVFLVGYSASGTFTDRFANLHPHKVKAVASGATLDDMMLPLAKHGGEDLIFPIGTADYKAITGRPFDLKAHNKVARLIFMGEDDTNNTLPFSDSYSDDERRIITKLWGKEVLPRAKELIQLYGEAGGEGIFILDKGVQHSMSQAMQEYLVTFLKANRDGEEPVYPIPSNPAQLKYTLFE